MQNLTFNGRYRALQQIGAGGFGLTYLAEDMHLASRPRVVVKHLKPQAADRQTLELANRLFQQEAEILYRLGGHPHIPSLIAHFKENGEFYLVQEFIEGHTLDRELTGGRKYNQKEVVQFLGQMLEILAFVHSQKVIHRDIKPANLIRRRADGNISLIDFGAVKQVSAAPRAPNSSTFSSVTVGSHGYMPMEQMAGNPNFASDLYALGLVTIEALTGIKPLELPKNAVTNEFVWAHKAQLSPELEHFITKLVRMDFRQRYFSASEALASLNPIAASIGFFHQRPAAPPVMMTVQPIAANQNFQPRPAPLADPHFVPPTVIVPAGQRAPANFAPSASHLTEENGARNAKIVFCSIAGILFFIGFLFVAGKVLNFRWSSLNQPNESARQTEFTKPSVPSFSLYEEATKQAEEAAVKEKTATTKFEWEEIGNKYKRAYGLLASIEATSPDYAKAQAKIEEYKQKAAVAAEQAGVSPEAPTLRGDSETVPVVIEPAETPFPTPATSTSPPRPKLTMPAKPAARSYLVYNADYGYSSDSRTYTSDEYNFRSKVNRDKYISFPTNTVEISGGGGRLLLTPPTGVEKLRPGTYQALQGESGYAVGNYTIRLDSFYCSQGASHSLTINGIVYDELYQNVSYLDATFSLRCGDRKALGRVRYDAR